MTRTSFTDLPYEIVSQILEEATNAIQRDGVAYTFGLSQATLPLDQPKTQKFVGGPARPDESKWEATKTIRSVCPVWHNWALEYTLRDVYIRKGHGGERWADLHRGLDVEKYRLYEFNNRPRGSALYHDPYRHLRQTVELIELYPETAVHIRRLWINGFYAAETDAMIWKLLRNCPRLESVSLPWTLLRRGTAEDWSKLLATETEYPLRSLELLSLDVSEQLSKDSANEVDRTPLAYRRVNFSQLHRLKFFGNTDFKPIVDDDLLAISRTATNLSQIFIANNSTITIAGLTHLIAASRQTIRTIEHSPRSEHGFAHPHPGFAKPTSPSDGVNNSGTEEDLHICTLLTSCPKLRDLSVSIPSMCSELFTAAIDATWSGVVQVRAAALCPTSPRTGSAHAARLAALLAAARAFTTERARCGATDTRIEIFYGDCIFEPAARRVHGDFAAPAAAHNAALLLEREQARLDADAAAGRGPVFHATRVDDLAIAAAAAAEADADARQAAMRADRLDIQLLRQQVPWLGAAREVVVSGMGPFVKDELPWVWVDEETFLEGVRDGSVSL